VRPGGKQSGENGVREATDNGPNADGGWAGRKEGSGTEIQTLRRGGFIVGDGSGGGGEQTLSSWHRRRESKGKREQSAKNSQER